MWCYVMWRHMTSLRDVTTWRHAVTEGRHPAGSGRCSNTFVFFLQCNEILPGDLDLWPTTLTYNPSPAKVKSHSKNQGHRSNSSAARMLTHRHTHTERERRYWIYYLDRVNARVKDHQKSFKKTKTRWHLMRYGDALFLASTSIISYGDNMMSDDIWIFFMTKPRFIMICHDVS